ncbi:phosphatidate cytidylyltransferase [Sporomusa acidovorans]|nr:phosphatidate cytidylyltransferase [Sporomusa acidovorans]
MRILTAAIGIPIAIVVINYGFWLFAITVILLALVAWHEFFKMMQAKDIKIQYSVGLVGILLTLSCAWLGNAQELLMVLMLILLVGLSQAIISHDKFGVTETAFTIFGTIYISLPFSHLILLRFTDQADYIFTVFGGLPAGAAYLWLAFVGTWASDTLAYFAGSIFGRHKLCPAISPGKTYEGALGGLIGSIAGVALMGWQLLGLPLGHMAILGLLIGVFAPLGDLAESVLKRFTGVKDSGNILPGHGGILDRFDAVMFSVPVVYYYIKAFFVV